jgi:RNA polymerase sigma factor (sigma-70 family)
LVKSFLSDLSSRQREIFDLCDLQGYSPSEVARLLELEPATIRVHLLRARAVIRTQILRHYPEVVKEHES